MSESSPVPADLVDGGISLRDLTPADREALVSLADDERLFTHMMIRFDRAEMDKWFTDWLAELEASPRSYWPLVVAVDGDVVGFVMCSRASQEVAELQWYISPRHWGRGCATSATRLMLPFIFDTLRMHRVFATADPDNQASIRTLERAGFRREGHMHDYVLTHRGWRDRVMFALLDHEWRSGFARAQ